MAAIAAQIAEVTEMVRGTRAKTAAAKREEAGARVRVEELMAALGERARVEALMAAAVVATAECSVKMQEPALRQLPTSSRRNQCDIKLFVDPSPTIRRRLRGPRW